MGRRRGLMLFLAAALLLTGCEDIDVSSLIDSPQTTTVPSVSPSADYVAPIEGEYRLGNLVLDLYPSQGETVRLSDSALASLAMEAANDLSLRTGATSAEPFASVVVIRNTDNQELTRFSVSGEGDLLGRTEDGALFRIPEWVYYQMEYTLWEHQTGFHSAAINWNPGEDDTILSLELPALITPLLVQANGYANAYLLTTKVYRVNVGTDQTKVYLLAGYAGYIVEGETFRPTFHQVTPITLTFDKVSNGRWRLSRYQEPADVTSQSSVRSILPYDETVQAMEDMKDTTQIDTEISRQVTSWLLENGQGNLTVVDYK